MCKGNSNNCFFASIRFFLMNKNTKHIPVKIPPYSGKQAEKVIYLEMYTRVSFPLPYNAYWNVKQDRTGQDTTDFHLKTTFRTKSDKFNYYYYLFRVFVYKVSYRYICLGVCWTTTQQTLTFLVMFSVMFCFAIKDFPGLCGRNVGKIYGSC